MQNHFKNIFTGRLLFHAVTNFIYKGLPKTNFLNNIKIKTMLALTHQSKKRTLQNFGTLIKVQPSKILNLFTGLSIKKDNLYIVESNTTKNTGFIKRLTPFLLFSVFLMGLFPYLMITHQSTLQNNLQLAIIFPFTVGSIFCSDNFLWNYYTEKKLGLIWIIEIATASFFLALSLLI